VADCTSRLMLAGATIHEINTVRKHCERLKGGRLSAACRAEGVHSYILSDVIGDPLDVIASGPTAPDPTTFVDAMKVIEKYGITQYAQPLAAHLTRGTIGEIPDSPKPGHPSFNKVINTIIGSNAMVLRAVAEKATKLGFAVVQVTPNVEGEAAEVGRTLAGTIKDMRPVNPQGPQHPMCVIIGGEPTVTVGDKKGKGGPSQELALAAAEALAGVARVALVAFSTDGRDGPTDAAGAVVTGETAAALKASGRDLGAALAEHDSYTALESVGALLKTSATGTNLNHVAALLVYPL
jgi:glycerate 2-kinase